MLNKQKQAPLYEAVRTFIERDPISFHVPGHKHGQVFSQQAKAELQSMLKWDLTELNGLDDLHAPEGAIAAAQQLAADWFQSKQSYFLINGSTVGNLAMILAACQAGDQVFVQRNCHKSILHGMELAGVQPIFLPPAYDFEKQRYTAPSTNMMKQALNDYPEIKAMILTYPDYFGDIFPLKVLIETAHANDITVLIDEAHGCHFSLPFVPVPSAGELGADIVVQSAHKMTPSLTMSAFLHVYTDRVPMKKVSYYLQMLQSSSPSYPLMVSLDLARCYLANYTSTQYQTALDYIAAVRSNLEAAPYWDIETNDDPFKLTLRIKEHLRSSDVQALFEEEYIYFELSTDRHLLFIFGLEPTFPLDGLQKKLERIKHRLKGLKHAKIEVSHLFFQDRIAPLALSYHHMQALDVKWCTWEEAAGQIAAEAIIPYPPGIPLIAKGERIEAATIKKIKQLFQLNIGFQPSHRQEGIYIFDMPEGE
ncbi:aminotransferase class I/II-fold pyridoxal phosphate-dependent enzyme [Gracilibacillus alcaliphilus]|uniref:aminotransferase class I/II-fold pyridoxal phosphate-dependent enzyme n=1 Tax=Gracilibacillus alcaliphilus TaxID=1401441 RepID=UPI00195AE5BA|nr:aminotransferase class I/II-fold pyridoxal phosphate-dependent enzyme [Gracilibacillus alcaliphilus]MBM7678085.1 lysine decarboxylase [Gracilibacillus alcaliphilus]